MITHDAPVIMHTHTHTCMHVPSYSALMPPLQKLDDQIAYRPGAGKDSKVTHTTIITSRKFAQMAAYMWVYYYIMHVASR